VARVALVGNPNVGKSTLFNALTGARQRVGNWPGKTVQVASGWWSTPAGTVELVDLPGTYSLAPSSPDEELVRDLIADRTAGHRPDLVVAVLDAANLARNLYLLSQVLETGVPVVAALTMTDVAAARGLRVDVSRLAGLLGVPVVPVVPRSGEGRDLLAEAVCAGRLADGACRNRSQPAFSADGACRNRSQPAFSAGPPRSVVPPGPARTDDPETELAERRFAWVRTVIAESVRRPERDQPTRSDRVDRVLTGRWTGLPVFLLVLWAVFEVTTRVAAPAQARLSSIVDGPVIGAVRWLLERADLAHTWFAALVVDGLVPGVGQLLTFTPLMLIMFVLLAVLEDSGYLARAAFVADHFLRLIGLPGQAFLPLMVGFGCNVPAVAGSRVLGGARQRLMTVLLVPLVTCSARLSLYLLLANAFFGRRAGLVVFAMYLLSVGLVLLAGLALRHTLLRGRPREALVLELPPYRRPAVRVVAAQAWQRLRAFLAKAGGVIVAVVALVWLLTAIPLGGGRFPADQPDSLYAGVSHAVAPVFAPAGFGDGPAASALITGFVAKEAAVSTLAQTYHAQQPAHPGRPGDLGTRLRAGFARTSGGHPQAAALAFLVFALAYTPCVATVAAQRAEIGLRWTLLGVAGQLAIAWTLATLVFQVGRLLL
jgi:ferrous iron transport protein B